MPRGMRVSWGKVQVAHNGRLLLPTLPPGVLAAAPRARMYVFTQC